MCTYVSASKNTSNGHVVTDFISFVFGGLVPNVYNQLVCSNDLIMIKSRQITEKSNNFVPQEGQDITTTDGVDEANY